MVARGAGAAGPVLLACRQWDHLGLAQRLPSLRVPAWRSAPLLPWRVQCPVRVCAALAASLGGPGRNLVLCPPRFPLPAPRVSRRVWRAVLSGCPLPSLAGTPFHAVSAFRELGPVALPVFAACPLCVCALALPRRPPPAPLPWVVWRAHLARSRRWALVGPFHAVRAPPRVLPRSLAPSGVLGGGRPGPVSPLPGSGLCAPRGVGLRVRGVPVLGGGVGGRGACAPRPPSARPGGPVVRGVALRRSVPLPSLGRQQSGCCWRRSGHEGRGPHTTPVRACLPSLGAACVVPWRVGAGALAPRGSCGSRRLGRGGGPCSGSPLGRRGPARGRGDHPLCLRGLEAGVPAARGPAGRWGGGVAPRPPCPPSGGRPAFPYTAPPLVVGAFPPTRAPSVGDAGPPPAPDAACRAGGGEGLPVNRSLGGHVRPKPSLRPPRVGHTALVRRRVPLPGVARASLRRACAGPPVGRDPRGSRRRGALGRAACGSSCAPPPPHCGPFWGRGGVPLVPGGAGGGGGRGGRSAAPRPPALSGVGVSSFVSGASPWGMLVLQALPGGCGR